MVLDTVGVRFGAGSKLEISVSTPFHRKDCEVTTFTDSTGKNHAEILLENVAKHVVFDRCSGSAEC